jgi:predicted Zn-dependent protease
MKNLILWACALLFLNACATSPLGRKQFAFLSDGEVAAMGDQAFLSLKSSTPLGQDRTANAYVECVAQAVILEVGGQWEVAVFQDETPNAFALPGGKIGVHTGILRVAENQHQLAAVLAHEVAHVLARHTNERMSQELAVKQGLNVIQALSNPTSPTGQAMMGLLGVGAKYGVLLPYSRVQESEADLVGLDIMAKAGFDPAESLNLWRNMERAGGGQPVEFMSTHPSHATRIQDLQQRIPYAAQLSMQARANGRNPRCDSFGRR